MNQREGHAESPVSTCRQIPDAPSDERARSGAGAISCASRATPDPNVDPESLLAWAQTRGLFTGRLEPRSMDVAGIDFRSALSRARGQAGKPALEPLGFFTPVDTFDPGLDPTQIDAVTRAAHATDLLLIQGLPGVGKTRVIAELIRQAVRQGKRVLLTAADGAAVDAALMRVIDFPGIDAVRLVGEGERVDALTPGLGTLVASKREKHLIELSRREAESAYKQLLSSRDAFSNATAKLHNLAQFVERIVQLDSELNDLLVCRTQTVDPLRGNAAFEHPGDDFWQRVSEQEAEAVSRIAEIQVQLCDLAKRRAALEAEKQGITTERETLRPLEEAGHSGKFWSVQFWKAKLNKSLPETLNYFEQRLGEIGAELGQLSEQEAALRQEMQDVELEQSAKRSQQLAAEIERRQRELDAREAEVKRSRCDSEAGFVEIAKHLPQLSLPEPRANLDWLRQAETVYAEALFSADREAELAKRWLELVIHDSESLLVAWRGHLNCVAGPLHVVKQAKWFTAPFDLMIADEAHRLDEPELLPAARAARRWILVGEPCVTGVPSSVAAGRNGRRPTVTRDFFCRLWDQLFCERWIREGDRLVFKCNEVTPVERSALEREAVADRPDIELRICAVDGKAPFLAEVAFPGRMGMADTRDFLFRELGEIPLRSNWRTGRWAEETDCFVFRAGGSDTLGANQTFAVGEHLSIRLHGSSAGAEAGFEVIFDKRGCWDRNAAGSWLREQLIRNDSGRACRLEMSYRHTPDMAAWLNGALATDFRYPVDGRPEAAVQFEPVPKRLPAGPRRGGAGYEIDLADPQQRELLSPELDRLLPAIGYVNLPEAQAIAELVPHLPRDRSIAITAAYAPQTMVLRHYLPQEDRIFTAADLAQRECDTLIVSLTRSHHSRAVTFGQHPSLVIGLLTRPRSRLVVVGDPGTLSRRAQWEGAIDQLDAVAGETERRWVNALLALLPTRHPANTRAPERARI